MPSHTQLQCVPCTLSRFRLEESNLFNIRPLYDWFSIWSLTGNTRSLHWFCGYSMSEFKNIVPVLQLNGKPEMSEKGLSGIYKALNVLSERPTSHGQASTRRPHPLLRSASHIILSKPRLRTTISGRLRGWHIRRLLRLVSWYRGKPLERRDEVVSVVGGCLWLRLQELQTRSFLRFHQL
jgi:hypothetical protein